MIVISRSLLVLLVLLLAHAAPAEEARPKLISALATLLLSSGSTESARAEVASSIGSACEDLSSRVPRLLSREEEWMAGEITGQRLVAVMRSPELAKRVLLMMFTDCAMGAKLAQVEQTRVWGWTMLAKAVNEPGMEVYLDRASFPKGQFEAALLLPRFTNQILTLIVLPELKKSAQAAVEAAGGAWSEE